MVTRHDLVYETSVGLARRAAGFLTFPQGRLVEDFLLLNCSFPLHLTDEQEE